MGKFFIMLGDACVCSCRPADADGVVSIHVLESCGRPVAALAADLHGPGGAEHAAARGTARGVLWGSKKGCPQGFRSWFEGRILATQGDDISVGRRTSDCTAAQNAALAAGQCTDSFAVVPLC